MMLCPCSEMLRTLSKKPYMVGQKDLKGRKSCKKAKYIMI